MDNVPLASGRLALTHATPLNRTIGLLLAVLYGLGVTVGAGIYVLIGVAASHAGPHAPLSFAIAAGVMGLTHPASWGRHLAGSRQVGRSVMLLLDAMVALLRYCGRVKQSALEIWYSSW